MQAIISENRLAEGATGVGQILPDVMLDGHHEQLDGHAHIRAGLHSG